RRASSRVASPQASARSHSTCGRSSTPMARVSRPMSNTSSPLPARPVAMARPTLPAPAMAIRISTTPRPVVAFPLPDEGVEVARVRGHVYHVALGQHHVRSCQEDPPLTGQVDHAPRGFLLQVVQALPGPAPRYLQFTHGQG